MKITDIKVEQEKRGDPIYIYLKPGLKQVKGAVNRTVWIEQTDVAVDLDENDEIIGIEIT